MSTSKPPTIEALNTLDEDYESIPREPPTEERLTSQAIEDPFMTEPFTRLNIVLWIGADRFELDPDQARLLCSQLNDLFEGAP